MMTQYINYTDSGGATRTGIFLEWKGKKRKRAYIQDSLGLKKYIKEKYVLKIYDKE